MTPPSVPVAALVTVIGIGNPYRRDDGAAGLVLRALGPRWGTDPRVRLVELDGESVRLVQAWEGASTVWIVDAVRSGRPPGSIHEVDARHLDELDDSGKRLGGGHLMGLGEAVGLAEALGLLPAELRILGIEGVDFDNGEGVTDEVAGGVSAAVEFLHVAIAAALLVSADPGE